MWLNLICTNTSGDMKTREKERSFPQDKKLESVKCWKTSIIILKQYQKIPLWLFFWKKSPNTKTKQANNNFCVFLASFILSKKSVHMLYR